MDVFDSITYAKGAAVLRMLEGYLGEDVFRARVRSYMRAHRFSNTTTADFWHHLSGSVGAGHRQTGRGLDRAAWIPGRESPAALRKRRRRRNARPGALHAHDPERRRLRGMCR